MIVRVGHIGFLNCYPLYFGLEHRGLAPAGDTFVAAAGGAAGGAAATSGAATSGAAPARPGVEFFPGVPTDLNRMLLAGEIDLGPISSIAYARDHRQLLISRHVSISAFGAVDSIQVVSRKPLTRVRRVALTPQSATAVALLKTIFKLRLEQDVEYRHLEGPPAGALDEVDAVLLIGDQGLDALYFPLPGTTCHDLGAMWQEWTGLPMVYAVWAAREDFARANGPELLAAETELVACRDYGREHKDDVVDAALGIYHYDRDSLNRYFALLRYDFTSEYQRSLVRFYELAHEAGELAEVPELRFIDEYAGTEAESAPGAGSAAGTSGQAPGAPQPGPDDGEATP